MKTKIKGVLAIVFALFMFSSVATKAQQPCPKIINQTQCTFKVVTREWIVDPQTGICNLLCSSTSIIVPPAASIPFPCSCQRPVCNRSIEVVAINGVPITPTVLVDYNTPPQHLPANPCGASGVRYDPSIPAFIFF